MATILWCKQKGKGIRFTRPGDIIADDYRRKADEALLVFQSVQSDEWRAVSAYYACYNMLYALAQKAGIICEIHDCTIALMPFSGFHKEQVQFFENLKAQRINAQYYTNKPFQVEKSNKIKDFVIECKHKFVTLKFEDVRKKIENA